MFISPLAETPSNSTVFFNFWKIFLEKMKVSNESDELIRMILKMFHFSWRWVFYTYVRIHVQLKSNITFLDLLDVDSYTHFHILSFKNNHGEVLHLWEVWQAVSQWLSDFYYKLRTISITNKWMIMFWSFTRLIFAIIY